MTNVITLAVPQWQRRDPAHLSDVTARLAQGFATQRRGANDVFWLKENAEFLNVVEATGQGSDAVLAAYELFYEGVEARLAFFPQYYRFHLSICLDFEDIGGGGGLGARLAEWVLDKGLPQTEMSDLQRLEARRLLARRGIEDASLADGLEERARSFMAQSDLFALPNKKLAYELTHVVFYLSEYGRCDPQLDPAAMLSLRYVGLWAFVEMNADLLAEVCIALRFAGEAPPLAWVDWLRRHMAGYAFDPNQRQVAADDYHEFLMGQWAQITLGAAPGFDAAPPSGVTPVFARPMPEQAPLREVSEALYHMRGSRSGNWSAMRPLLWDVLSEGARQRMAEAEASCACFSEFFSNFARGTSVRRARA